MTIELGNTFALGSHIKECLKKALNMANEKQDTVTFDFNSRLQTVTPGDNIPDLLARWQADMDAEHAAYLASPAYQEHLREAEAAAKAQAIKDASISQEISGRTIEFALGGEEKWETCKAKNSDPYGSGCIRFATRWALLMQARMEAGASLDEVAEQAGFDADNEGITGFMFGAATSILSEVWAHGSGLRAAVR